MTTLPAGLAAVQDAPFLLDAIRAADALSIIARGFASPAAVQTLLEAVSDDDQVLSIAAVQALGQVGHDDAARALTELLGDDRPFLREHAAIALGARAPWPDAMRPLVSGVTAGGFPTMLHQRVLRNWGTSAPHRVSSAIDEALTGTADADARARLLDALSSVPGAAATRTLLRAAGDDHEPDRSRTAAVAALGGRAAWSRTALTGVLEPLALRDDEVGEAARLALFDLGVPRGRRAESAHTGLTVAQLFLHADLDRELSRAGAGDNGGIATMLVRLGDALVAQPGVERVLTMSRGSAGAALETFSGKLSGHVLIPVPLLSDAVTAAGAWPLAVAAERGIRRTLTAVDVDVVHLRMGDVGSMVAAEVAAELGIPTVFTLAPDPQAVVQALDMTGALSRRTFGTADEREHYWFRIQLVHRLAADARHCALFPRPELRNQLRDLLGIDIDDRPGRFTVVPEGIDLSVIKAAKADVHTHRQEPALLELEQLVAGLPAERHGLPLAISVGRLHRVKGMATVVQAWAADPQLRRRCNLLVVGGDLDHPSSDEQGQLDEIRAVLDEHPSGAAGLIVPGHRPNDVVAHWLAAAALGLGDLVGEGGVYVCGSLKEEFGLALVEAIAAGLVVVGPDGGGPATYVEDGVTGFLVDTRSAHEVATGMSAALDLVRAPGDADRAARARRMISERYTVQAMAGTLREIYAHTTSAMRPAVLS